MNQTEKIAKGQHHLKMRVRQKYGNELSDSDLMKIPLEGLHSIALQQIGEQESYIEELEETIAFLKKELANKEEKALLTRNEKKKIAKEVRRDKEIEKIHKESSEFKGENKRLREEIKELVGKLWIKTKENEALRAQLR
jgi:hypothetical protein